MSNAASRHFGIRTALLLGIGLAALACPAGVAEASSSAVRDAHRDLIRIRYEIERQLRARPEMVQAKQDWVDARMEYSELRREVVETLSRDADYLATRAKLWELQDKLDAIHHYYRNGRPPMDIVSDLANQVLALDMQLTEMERRALEQHQAAIEAKRAYVEAGKRLLELNRALQDHIRNDPKYRQALTRVRQLRSSGTTLAIVP